MYGSKSGPLGKSSEYPFTKQICFRLLAMFTLYFTLSSTTLPPCPPLRTPPERIHDSQSNKDDVLFWQTQKRSLTSPPVTSHKTNSEISKNQQIQKNPSQEKKINSLSCF